MFRNAMVEVDGNTRERELVMIVFEDVLWK